MRELKGISSEKAKDFFYATDLYADDYDEDSIGAVIFKWNEAGYSNFRDTFPITTKVITKVKSVNDGRERPREVYAAIISLAKDALEEVNDYIKHSLSSK